MPPIFLLTGTPAAGKSTTSRALLRRFRKGIHIEVDALRDMVCQGYANPVADWNAETELQFSLARAGAIDMALRYQAQGFAVAIDDVAPPTVVDAVYRSAIPSLVVVALIPTVSAALHRSDTRTNKNFPPESLIDCITEIATLFRERASEFHDACVIDSTNLSLEEVVDCAFQAALSVQ